MEKRATTGRFYLPARILHWLMAVMVIAMLFVGAGMVSTVGRAHEWLIAWHKPLGLAILALVLIRIAVRLTHRPPPLPTDLPAWQRHAATLSHWLLYALLLLMPLLGWSMLSAAGYPVQIVGGFHIPPIAPHNLALYTVLRNAHSFFAYLLFLTFLAHLAAAMYHGLIRKDGVFQSMLFGRRRREARRDMET
jgi:cytochrome b561